jgi:hypothetical protein
MGFIARFSSWVPSLPYGIWVVNEDQEVGATLQTAQPDLGVEVNINRATKLMRTFANNARFLTDRAEHERAMAATRHKYWMYRPVIELGRILTTMGFMRDNTGSFEVTLAG